VRFGIVTLTFEMLSNPYAVKFSNAEAELMI